MAPPTADFLPRRPRVVLAHRILERLLEQVGIRVALHDPDALLEPRHAAWLDLQGSVQLRTATHGPPTATVHFDPPERPRSAVVNVHVVELSRAPEALAHAPELVADVQISPALVADIFGEEAAG